MKRSLLLLLFLLTAFSMQVKAQASEAWEWEDYKIKFALPKGCKVEKSTGESFEASKTGFFIGIYPFSDESVTKENLKEATISIAEEAKYDSIEDGGEADLNGFEGYYVEGTKDGAKALIVSLLDEKSDTNFFAVIAYAPDMENYAVMVLKSLQKL
jgi:Dihydro-orotase-like